jgi:restriction system protein
LAHLREVNGIPANKIFEKQLIINSRINISPDFSVYGALFPHRSKIALWFLWDNIRKTKCSKVIKLFLEDAFLSILPQAKYKDYRSKSQDLHCPPVQLREVNLLYRFEDQVKIRFEGLSSYSFSTTWNDGKISEPIQCQDFRKFLKSIPGNSAELIFTDPPWCDGNAYFEKAQLYHPWLGINLSQDADRLENEFVVTNAPTRSAEHNFERWWEDLDQFFALSNQNLKENKFLALYFRPIPAKAWLKNLNQLKLIARKNCFEPILSIDVGSSDPSMRIQQSASYLFSADIIFLFYKLPQKLGHVFDGYEDIDQLVYKIAETCQENKKGPFTFKYWREEVAKEFLEMKLLDWNSPGKEGVLLDLFNRYCDNQGNGLFLPKPNTPFSGQLFDTPAIERLFTYVPQVVEKLTEGDAIFSYDHFLLSLATFVENGTRSLIGEIDKIDIRKLLAPYAIPQKGGRFFKKRPLPSLPKGIDNLLKMDPYKFEEFIAHLLTKQGYTNVAVIGRSGDRGVDVVAKDTKGLLTVVQCKRFINNVNATPIQRLHSFAVTRGAQRKILVTTSDFTKQAKEEAKSTNTELVSGKILEGLMAKYLGKKFK